MVAVTRAAATREEQRPTCGEQQDSSKIRRVGRRQMRRKEGVRLGNTEGVAGCNGRQMGNGEEERGADGWQWRQGWQGWAAAAAGKEEGGDK
ncbi:hypothetical protein GW17_00028304 [Ensete ventricosum]|nr:hypothetical protein GW17_00028304 [Ensete ventricosum]